MDGERALPLVHGRQHAVDALAELRAVGEPGQFVELGEMGDALLRALALGDVLQDDDRAAVRHHAARHRDGAVAVGRGVELVELVLAQAVAPAR